jgi:hypothetical protein
VKNERKDKNHFRGDGNAAMRGCVVLCNVLNKEKRRGH